MKRVAIIAVLAAMSAVGMCQNAFRQVPVPLNEDTRNLTIVDSVLYCSSSNILIKAAYRKGSVINLDAALDMMNVNAKVDYIVRHPRTGALYFTLTNGRGITTMYEYVQTGKKPLAKLVNVGGNRLSVCHPVFNADGTILVFSSGDGFGFGGMDLWYSQLTPEGWGEPKNFGHKVNTSFDETSPCIYGDYLIFVSDGRGVNADEQPEGKHQAYVTRLVATHQDGDTVMMVPIGQSPVQKLPSPFNSRFETMELTADPASGRIYWVSGNGGKVSLWEMEGSLQGAQVEGVVSDEKGRPLEGVKVKLLSMENNVTAASAVTDTAGKYVVVADSDRQYVLLAEKTGFFSTSMTLSTNRNEQNPDLMISEHKADVVLKTLDLGKPYSMGTLFGPNADVELTEEGEAELRKVVVFLNDNPELKVKWSVWSDATDNPRFNQMVTDQRLATLQDYLESHGVKAHRLKMTNTNAASASEAKATGTNRCMITLSK